MNRQITHETQSRVLTNSTNRKKHQAFISILCFILISPLSALDTNVIDQKNSLDTPLIKKELQKSIDMAKDDESLMVTQLQQSKSLKDAPVVHMEPGSEKHAEPVKLFDNLYYVGGTKVGCFIFTTSEGYIMIDSGYSYMAEDYILPGMQKLGLDPAKIKYILITHSGPDHTGGVSFFQKKYGTRIIMSKEEWASVPKNGGNYFGAAAPEMDIIAIDGQKISLGELTITMVKTPRTVKGGGFSYIAEIYDNGTPHVFATYGNTNTVGSLEDKKVYRESVKKFLSYINEKKVDVIISNHPFVDGSIKLMEQLSKRKSGEANPFVFGQNRVVKFFELLDQCAIVVTLRQEAGLDETGTKYLKDAGTGTQKTQSAWGKP